MGVAGAAHVELPQLQAILFSCGFLLLRVCVLCSFFYHGSLQHYISGTKLKMHMSLKTDLVSSLSHRETTGKFHSVMKVSDALAISEAWVRDNQESMDRNGNKKLSFNFSVDRVGDACILYYGSAPNFLKWHILHCNPKKNDLYTVDTTCFFAVLDKLRSWVTSRLQNTWKNETCLQMTSVLTEMATKNGYNLQIFVRTPYISADSSMYAYVLSDPSGPAYLCMLVKVDDWEVKAYRYGFSLPWDGHVWHAWCHCHREDIQYLQDILVSNSDSMEEGDSVHPSSFRAQDEAALGTLSQDCVHYLESWFVDD
jgi:hypothetical protein